MLRRVVGVFLYAQRDGSDLEYSVSGLCVKKSDESWVCGVSAFERMQSNKFNLKKYRGLACNSLFLISSSVIFPRNSWK